jgi:hypothetical protein
MRFHDEGLNEEESKTNVRLKGTKTYAGLHSLFSALHGGQSPESRLVRFNPE